MATITRSHGTPRDLPGDAPGAGARTASRQTAGGGWLRRVHLASWIVLLTALVAVNFFARQVVLVPPTRDYQPNWHGAQWITAPNPTGAVAYYRKSLTLATQPTGAFVTIQAAQDFRLYVNGSLVDDTSDEFQRGMVNRAHIYDVAPLLQNGNNAVALCVDNRDGQQPAARAVIGLAFGSQSQTFPTDATWHATDDVTRVKEPCYITNTIAWAQTKFDDSSWQGAAYLSGQPEPDGVVAMNPATYELPLPTRWISAGPSGDGFFYGSITLPQTREVWLRAAPNGDADIYLNGHRMARQPGQISLDQNNNPVPWQAQWTAGIYDVTPYVHAGQNALAVHVTSVGTLKGFGVVVQPAAVALDLLAINQDGSLTRRIADGSWRASEHASPGWITGATATTWPTANEESFSNFTATQPYRLLASPYQEISLLSTLQLLVITTLLFALACAAAVAAQRVGQREAASVAVAVDRVALALLPALGLMGLLLALNNETLIPDPFPYTPLWLGMLVAVAIASFLLILWLPRLLAGRTLALPRPRLPIQRLRSLPPRQLAAGAAVVVMATVGLVLVMYNLGYEPYWQDEIQSVNAAHGVLQTGLPRLFSGFLYPKAELFSYMLAGIIAVFGDAASTTRMFGASEYVVNLVLTYFVGSYFFGRRVALVGMALLLLWPLELTWGREARMYSQAQLFTLVVLYLFYRAVQPDARPRAIYLSMVAVVVMYLSHEETFILLPAIALYFFATQRLRWIKNYHWWVSGLAAITIILAQYYLTKVTHPPILGTDITQRPLVGYSADNLDFYIRLLFINGSMLGGFARSHFGVVSFLAVAAGILALFTRHRALRYFSVFLFVPLLSLMLLFSLTADRYLYPVLPVFTLLAAYVIIWT
ncbi:MAG: glycosyltransferase family 39 protein, partial [Ktedonobacterales bacterium]|nr:glycosyltransferase family 39 protein [Ktedonobacterales bacterium]